MGDRLHGFQSPRVMKDDCRMKAGLLYSKEGVGAHARIRTGDLFLTKWSSIPGEFGLILSLPVDFGGDHLTQHF